MQRAGRIGPLTSEGASGEKTYHAAKALHPIDGGADHRPSSPTSTSKAIVPASVLAAYVLAKKQLLNSSHDVEVAFLSRVAGVRR
jgi:hypothetical protein